MINFQLNHISFRYFDLIIKVKSRNISDIVWIKEFLYPQFEIVDSSSHGCEIEYCADDTCFDEFYQKKPEEKAEIDGFILDTKIIKLVVWESTPMGQLLFDEKFNVFYLVSHDRRYVCIIAHSKKSHDARTTLMRVIREFAINHAHTHADSFIHSAAFSYNGKGVLIAGPKDTGKTSSLIYFLQNNHARFISNDRILVSFEKPSPVIRGMPTIITLTANTFKMYPKLKNGFLRNDFHHGFTWNEVLERKYASGNGQRQEFTLSPRQFCMLLDVESTADSQLSGILFPLISRDIKGIHLEELSYERAVERLRTAQLSKKYTGIRSIFDVDRDKESLIRNMSHYEEFISRLALHIPCFDYHVGFRAFEDYHNAPELINKIFSSKAVQCT
jgi:hypothetical protein